MPAYAPNSRTCLRYSLGVRRHANDKPWQRAWYDFPISGSVRFRHAVVLKLIVMAPVRFQKHLMPWCSQRGALRLP